MKKICLGLATCIVMAAFIGLLRINPVNARPAYYKAFKKTYVGEEKTDAQKSLAKEIKRVEGCNVCHDPRKDADGIVSKKNRNPFGMQLAKLLSKEDQKNSKKILESFAKVEKVKLEGCKETIGETLKSGKLPFEYKEEKEEKK